MAQRIIKEHLYNTQDGLSTPESYRNYVMIDVLEWEEIDLGRRINFHILGSFVHTISLI